MILRVTFKMVLNDGNLASYVAYRIIGSDCGSIARNVYTFYLVPLLSLYQLDGERYGKLTGTHQKKLIQFH